MHKLSFALRTAAFAAVFALIAGSSLQAQEEGGGRGARGQRGGGQRGGAQRGGRQRSPRGGLGQRTSSKVDLLRMEEVQKELKIEGDSLETVTGMLTEYRGKVRELGESLERPEFDRSQMMDRDAMTEYRKKLEEYGKKLAKKVDPVTKETEELLAAVLEEEQWNRLNQIYFQSLMRRGMLPALMNKEMAAKLKLSKEQSAKLETIKKDSDKTESEVREKMREMFRGGGSGARSSFDEMRKAGEERRKKVEEKTKAVLSEEQQKMITEVQGKKFSFPETRRGGFGGFGGGRGAGGGGRGGRGGRDGGGGGSDRPSRPGGGGGGGAA